MALVVASLVAGCERDAGTPTEDATRATGAPSAGVPAPQGAARITEQAEAAARLIDGEKIRRVVAEIADDRYGGRLPGTEGDQLTRAYLAAELARVGFASGEGGSY